jgi:outer membrane cobalamin receptor
MRLGVMNFPQALDRRHGITGPLARTAAALGAALTLLAAAPHDSAGQARPDSTRADSARAPIPLDPVIATASRLPLRPGRSGFTGSVLTRAQLEAERPVYAFDALRELPGSFIDEALGPGGPAIIRLRGGEEVFTQILMDGVQLNENGGFFDFQGVTLGNVERVEVARGPQGALYGSAAVSGVVQFTTAPGEAGPLRLGGRLEGGAGTGDGRNFTANAHARGGSNRLLYSGGGGVTFNRGIYDLPNDTWTRDASLRLDARPAQRWHFTTIARYLGVESMQPVRDPGATRVPLDPNARIERDRLILTGGANFQPSPRASHGLRVSLFRQDFLYHDERDDITQPDDFFVFDASFDFAAVVQRTTVEYTGRLGTSALDAGPRLAVAYGGQWELEDLGTEQSGDFGSQSVDLDRQSRALFAEAIVTPHPRIDLMAGARAEDYDGLATELTPRGSLVVHVVPERLSLRAAAGRAYKVPNLQEQYLDNAFIAPNPDLEPETSVSWEAGADLLAGDRSRWSVTGFRQDYRNLIRSVAGAVGERAQNRNVGRSRAWGVEGTVRYRLKDGLVAGLDAARTWTRIIDNTGLPEEQYPRDGTLPFRPELTASAHLRAALTSSLDVTGRATYIGEQVVLTERFSGRRETLDPYVRVDMTMNLALAPQRSVYLRLVNLLDTDYETAFDRPGLPLSAALGFEIAP